MSTRGFFSFRDDEDRCHVFKHSDCYPHGGMSAICNALPFAWRMPRFEANEFAAAFVAGNKGALSAAAIRLKLEADKLPEPGFMEDYEFNAPIKLSRLYRDYSGGGIRLMPSGKDVHWHDAAPGDVEYLYDVRAEGAKLMVTIGDIIWTPDGEHRSLVPVWSGDILPMKDFTWKDWTNWGTQFDEKLEAA